jgi:hypothetical protein
MDLAEELGTSYERLMMHAQSFLEYGEYWSEGGRFEGFYIPDEFWVHYQIVVDHPIDQTKTGNFLSCSC